MCQQYNELSIRMKRNMKNYQDKLKQFLKIVIRGVPFFKNLSEDSIEEITYHLKQKYYQTDEIIFRAGSPVDYLQIITKGEVDLIMKIDNHELVSHNLYQGCHIGGYKILDDFAHSHTARAVNSVTLHYITKDSLSLLANNIPEINNSIEKAKNYIRNSQMPIIGFGIFKDPKGNISALEIFKMAVVKIIKLNRDLKKFDCLSDVTEMLELGEYGDDYISKATKKPRDFLKASLKLINKLTHKIDSMEGHIKFLEEKLDIQRKQKRKKSMRVLSALSAQRNAIEGNFGFII